MGCCCCWSENTTPGTVCVRVVGGERVCSLSEPNPRLGPFERHNAALHCAALRWAHNRLACLEKIPSWSGHRAVSQSLSLSLLAEIAISTLILKQWGKHTQISN